MTTSPPHPQLQELLRILPPWSSGAQNTRPNYLSIFIVLYSTPKARIPSLFLPFSTSKRYKPCERVAAHCLIHSQRCCCTLAAKKHSSLLGLQHDVLYFRLYSPAPFDFSTPETWYMDAAQQKTGTNRKGLTKTRRTMVLSHSHTHSSCREASTALLASPSSRNAKHRQRKLFFLLA